jgi:hypothetical protein
MAPPRHPPAANRLTMRFSMVWSKLQLSPPACNRNPEIPAEELANSIENLVREKIAVSAASFLKTS